MSRQCCSTFLAGSGRTGRTARFLPSRWISTRALSREDILNLLSFLHLWITLTLIITESPKSVRRRNFWLTTSTRTWRTTTSGPTDISSVSSWESSTSWVSSGEIYHLLFQHFFQVKCSLWIDFLMEHFWHSGSRWFHSLSETRRTGSTRW